MRPRLLACLVVALAGCATDDPAPDAPARDLLEEAWVESIRPGDVIIAVPGTGGYTTLGVHIEAQATATPDGEVDGRTVIGGAETLEGAIAAAQRAGITDAQLEAGAVELAIWGAAITRVATFRYHSLGGLHVRFHVLGGTSVCAVGGIAENLTDYNAANAEVDARDLYRSAQRWLALRPAVERKVTLVAHSWGGAVTTHFATRLATYIAEDGPLRGSTFAFAVAAGVPAYVPGTSFLGPGFRTIDSTAGDVRAAMRTYEIARPDDPARTFDPRGDGGGHHYIIMFGDAYQGWYGITTDALSCAGVPGACPPRT